MYPRISICISVLLFLAAGSLVTPAQEVDQKTEEAREEVGKVKVDLDKARAEELADYWIGQGYEELEHGRISNAMEAFNHALELAPGNRSALFGLGTTYVELREYRKALDTLEDLAERFPDDYALKNNIAWIYATASDHSVRNGRKAIEVAQSALLIAPSDYHVWSTLSEAYYVTGEYDRALRASREALRIAEYANASVSDIRDYQKQIDKASKAAQAMSLME